MISNTQKAGNIRKNPQAVSEKVFTTPDQNLIRRK